MGIVAAIQGMKGHRYLVDAIPDIVKESASRVKFLIVGEGTPSLITELRDKINAQGLAENCIFPGTVMTFLKCFP